MGLHGALLILGVILVPLIHARTLQKRAAFYIANETACVVDNIVYYNGDPIPTDDPCEACRCRPPGFACILRECEVKPGCRAVRRSGHCCPEYVCGCEHNGRMYRDGDEIRDSQNPCYTCHCQGSAIACAFKDCFFRVDCAPTYIPGECCPRYEHCSGDQSDDYPTKAFGERLDPTILPQKPFVTTIQTVPTEITDIDNKVEDKHVLIHLDSGKVDSEIFQPSIGTTLSDPKTSPPTVTELSKAYTDRPSTYKVDEVKEQIGVTSTAVPYIEEKLQTTETFTTQTTEQKVISTKATDAYKAETTKTSQEYETSSELSTASLDYKNLDKLKLQDIISEVHDSQNHKKEITEIMTHIQTEVATQTQSSIKSTEATKIDKDTDATSTRDYSKPSLDDVKTPDGTTPNPLVALGLFHSSELDKNHKNSEDIVKENSQESEESTKNTEEQTTKNTVYEIKTTTEVFFDITTKSKETTKENVDFLYIDGTQVGKENEPIIFAKESSVIYVENNTEKASTDVESKHDEKSEKITEIQSSTNKPATTTAHQIRTTIFPKADSTEKVVPKNTDPSPVFLHKEFSENLDSSTENLVTETTKQSVVTTIILLEPTVKQETMFSKSIPPGTETVTDSAVKITTNLEETKPSYE